MTVITMEEASLLMTVQRIIGRGEYDEDGHVQREYVYLEGLLLALITPTGIYYYHTDHLGTPESLTDQDQAIVWQAHHDPFGRASVTTQAVVNNLRFPGQYFDTEMGSHYNYFRDYDPSLGRYIQSDPIGLAGGLNTYEYALNNPIRVYDPFGLEANKGCVAACTVGGGVIGGGLGYLGGGLLGGGGGTLVAPGLGTVGGAIGGAELGGAAGAAAGSAAGNAAGEALCPDDDEEECDMELIGKRPSFDGKTYTCVYKSKGNIFTFPQAVGYESC